MANAIVKAVANAKPETLKTITYIENGVEHSATTNPVGYQTVLYVTGALYVVALLLSLFLVRPSQKALEAKAAKKAK